MLRSNTLSLTALLGSLTAAAPFSVYMYLSSLPEIGRSLDASMPQVQLTLSAGRLVKHARDDGQQASEQMEIAFENVKAALGSVGASFNQVVKLNNYIVDIGTNIAHYREVRDKYVNKEAPPASTTIGVPQLARPGALFEVEAIAVLPPK
jgi:enamine deaminase RidA (YjgF/YER057c/UK114 family)